MLWHGKDEEYDNVYYLEGPAEPPDAAGLEKLISEIASAEKPIHGTRVNFVRGRVWSAGGTKEQNITLALVDLTGQGDLIGAQTFGELAILVEWECGRRNIKGRKVYLRKYIRVGNGAGVWGPGVRTGEEAMGVVDKRAFKEYADRVQTIVAPAGVNWQLRSKGGRLPRFNNNGVINDFAISREFRRN
jgi:hypothetical protein